MTDTIFVFGSNLAGRHGKGAAKFALQHKGAIYGQGEGLQGMSYAIPTKDAKLKTLPLFYIQGFVNEFLKFAKSKPEWYFTLTPIGCGLAGYKPEDVGPMFKNSPSNVIIPEEFEAFV